MLIIIYKIQAPPLISFYEDMGNYIKSDRAYLIRSAHSHLKWHAYNTGDRPEPPQYLVQALEKESSKMQDSTC